MVSFPHCKINLGLHVLRRRADGYHDLETAFYPLPLRDILEIIPAAPPAPPQAASSSDTSSQPATPSGTPIQSVSTQQPNGNFMASGLPIPGDPKTNLCTKAWHLLKKDFPDLPPVDTWLYKNIPMGAGLGGGSSDGAAMLKLLNGKFHLNLSRGQLTAYALQLGSDCPFFLYDQPCYATGRGETLEPIALDLSDYSIALVYPRIHISTADAFAALQPRPPATPLKEILAEPVTEWRNTLINDFEEPLCRLHPELQKIKEKLYGAGAVYASMTGSGSAFYGLFPRETLPGATLFPDYFFRIL
jgi:4-diphosphocytidyl-2-C-methyl-D-erythritol kinase